MADKMPKRRYRTTPAAEVEGAVDEPFLHPERSGIHVRQTGCAICHEKYSVGSILELFLSTHIQSIGDVTYPAKYKGRSVEIHVCMPCFEEQNNLVINSVKNYHQGSDN